MFDAGGQLQSLRVISGTAMRRRSAFNVSRNAGTHVFVAVWTSSDEASVALVCQVSALLSYITLHCLRKFQSGTERVLICSEVTFYAYILLHFVYEFCVSFIPITVQLN